MARVHSNLVANFAGQGWSAALAIVLVPIYINLLGIESYGLIGFFATLQAALRLLDLGLGQTMNRQMARYAARPEDAAEARDFVRTLEVAYWGVGVAIGVAIAVTAPAIARYWLGATKIPVEVVERAVRIMGFVTAAQWPLSLYEGALMGLERQVALNLLKSAVATVAGGGAVLILTLVSPTITAYFAWQVAMSASQVGLTAVLLWTSLPRVRRRAVFSTRLLLTNWRFAAGMSGISVSAVALLHLDKIILSKILTLEMFGYYMLAVVVSGAIPSLVAGPVFYAVFPRFTFLVASEDEVALKHLYHAATQLMAVVAVAVAAVLAFFSGEVLTIWTGSEVTAAAASPIVSLLVLGAGLNALMTLPYALQLAHGWTSVGLRINLGLTAILVPSLVTLTTRYGVLGAAATWAGLNGIYMAVAVPLTHRRLLTTEMRAWFVQDVFPPAAMALLVAAAARVALRPGRTPALTLLGVVAALAATLATAALTAPSTRTWMGQAVARVRRATER